MRRALASHEVLKTAEHSFAVCCARKRDEKFVSATRIRSLRARALGFLRVSVFGVIPETAETDWPHVTSLFVG